MVHKNPHTAGPDNVFIPFHRASIGDEEIHAVTEVLRSGWLTTGPRTVKFETEFARYVGARYAVAVNSCTAALQLALEAIHLRPDDQVVLPTYTFTATAEVVTYFGARPVLCDCVTDGFNLDAAALEAHITPRTRVIMPVHIAGEPCDLDAVHAIAARHGLKVIEDAAHALPSTYHGRKVGSMSDMAAFSFYATKTLTTGEGGMLTTNRAEYAERARQMRLHGIAGDAWKRYSKEGSWYYEVVDAGYKLNLTDIAAALGLVQLAKADEMCRRRTGIARRYIEAFSPFEELQLPSWPAPGIGHAWHLFILRVRPRKLNLSRNEFVDRLKALGIGTSVHFIPLHLHPYYQRTYGYRPGDFPNAEDAYARCISLPIFPGMTEGEIETVIAVVRSIVTGACKRAQAVA
jgi:dTDP-4-amino-4,6-dideoxygalactose transaminase